MSFYKGLYQIQDSIFDIKVIEENDNVVTGEYYFIDKTNKGKKIGFNFIEIKQNLERPYSVFLNNLNLTVSTEQKIQGKIEKDILNFQKERLSNIVGVQTQFVIDKSKKSVIFNLSSFIPFVEQVADSKNILYPQINIMIAAQIQILEFLAKLLDRKN